MGAEGDEAMKAFSGNLLSINLVRSSTQEKNKKNMTQTKQSNNKQRAIDINWTQVMLYENICGPSSNHFIISVPCSLGSCSLATSQGP